MANLHENPNDLGRIQKYLLAPREEISFKVVHARVEKIDPDIKINPVVITTVSNPDYIGVNSGRRSGLLYFGNHAYKIKGCNIESALKEKGYYRKTHGVFAPEGGLLLSSTQRETVSTLLYNEIMSKEGFKFPYTPVAEIFYGKNFVPLLIPIFIEELTASVMEIKGDTRLAELFNKAFVKNYGAVSDLAYRFGLMAGAQKRVINHQLIWGAPPYNLDNYVIFKDGNNIYLGMGDFEDGSKYNLIKIRSTINEKWLFLRFLFFDLHYKLDDLLSRQKKDTTGIRSAKEYDNGYTAYLLAKENRDKDNNGRRFLQGYKDGYRNPDRRETITIDDLCEGFLLPLSISENTNN